MDRFAVLPSAEKVVYFEMTAASLNMSPELVEKDFWVCWTLKHIFSLDEIGAHITFKGGTSLSKCFDAIQRFSEDIDIAIERTYLEHERNIEPSLSESNKENKRRIEELMSSARFAIEHKILPGLRQEMASVLGHDGSWSIVLDLDDYLRQTLLFEFPAAIAKRVNDYIKPVVRIELGARSDHWPAQSAKVVPYVAESLRGA
jgi:predicted nucleotidyltransferase component of viral defense system